MDWVKIATVTVSVIAALVAVYNARVAIKAVSVDRLFTSFDLASRVTIANPKLLHSVHGLDSSTTEAEAASIAYLSLLLDAFQQFYDKLYAGKFHKMAANLTKESTFLNRILAVPENQVRWPKLKAIYYGDFDQGFIEAIEAIIKHEQEKAKRSVTV